MKKIVVLCIIMAVCAAHLFAADGRVYWLTDGVTIDGAFDEWDGLEAMVTEISVYGGDHDAKDAEGSFILATDGDTLFIYVDVTDDEVRLNTFHNSLAWKGDSAEVYFGHLPGFREEYEIGDNQLRLVPRDDTDPLAQDFYISYDYAGGGAPVFGEVALEVKRRGYTMEASVALEELSIPPLRKGQITRCEFQLNDADKIERDRLLRWSSDMDDYYTPQNWGRCPIVEP